MGKRYMHYIHIPHTHINSGTHLLPQSFNIVTTLREITMVCIKRSYLGKCPNSVSLAFPIIPPASELRMRTLRVAGVGPDS